MAKRPKLAPSPPRNAAKAVPGRATDVDPYNETLIVRFNAVDLGGPWCLSAAESKDIYNILDRLRGFESMRIREIFGPGSEIGKDYPIDDLPNSDAKKRLDELPYGDQVKIHRLRIDGPGRLYGFLRGREFFALWWDPQHKIWPSQKKNT